MRLGDVGVDVIFSARGLQLEILVWNGFCWMMAAGLATSASRNSGFIFQLWVRVVSTLYGAEGERNIKRTALFFMCLRMLEGMGKKFQRYERTGRIYVLKIEILVVTATFE